MGTSIALRILDHHSLASSSRPAVVQEQYYRISVQHATEKRGVTYYYHILVITGLRHTDANLSYVLCGSAPILVAFVKDVLYNLELVMLIDTPIIVVD